MRRSYKPSTVRQDVELKEIYRLSVAITHVKNAPKIFLKNVKNVLKRDKDLKKTFVNVE